jgi:hypothetical protein
MADMPNELDQAFRRIAQLMEDKAKAAAPERLSPAISHSTRRGVAQLLLRRNPPDAIARFFGAKRRTGWYAASRFRGSMARQFDPWVGNQWDPGETGGRPYWIGDAVNDTVPEAIEILDEIVLGALTRR